MEAQVLSSNFQEARESEPAEGPLSTTSDMLDTSLYPNDKTAFDPGSNCPQPRSVEETENGSKMLSPTHHSASQSSLCSEAHPDVTRVIEVQPDAQTQPFKPEQNMGKSASDVTTKETSPIRDPTNLFDSIPNCAVKYFVLHIGKKLSRPEEELLPHIHRLVCVHWLESLDHLKALSLSEWERLELPRQLLRAILAELPQAEGDNSRSTGGYPLGKTGNHSSNTGHPSHPVSVAAADIAARYGARTLPCQMSEERVAENYTTATGPTTCTDVRGRVEPYDSMHTQENVGSPGRSLPLTNEVVDFICHVCYWKHFDAADAAKAVQCLYEDNWFDKSEHLRGLSTSQWEALSLDPNVRDALLDALRVDGDDSLDRIIIKAGSKLGRSAAQLQETIEKLRANEIKDAQALRTITESNWTLLKLPLRLLEEVREELTVHFPVLRSPSSATLPCSDDYGQYTRAVAEAWCAAQGSPVTDFRFSAYRQQGSTLSTDSGVGRNEVSVDPRIVSTKEEREKRMITVEQLLLKAGENIGRTPVDMKSIIHSVVNENWVDSIYALRAMSDADWLSIGIPQRVCKSLNACFVDPQALRLETVQFTPPEADLFPVDVISAVWKLEAEIPSDLLSDTIRSMLRLLETILCHPFDPTKRMIRKANVNFQKRLGQYKSGVLLLQAIGFCDLKDVYVLFTAYISRITDAHAALAQLAQLQRDRLRKAKHSKTGLFSALR